MRGQAAMEFVLVFVFAFILFIIVVGVIATSTIGFTDRAPQEAALVLDVIALHTSTLERLDPADNVTIRFTVPEGSLANAQLANDTNTLMIVRNSMLIASRTILIMERNTDDVSGEREIGRDSGVITLA